MVTGVTSTLTDAEMQSLQQELELALNSYDIRESVRDLGEFRLARHNFFSFFTGTGLYIGSNRDGKVDLVRLNGWRYPASCMNYDNCIDFVPDAEILSTREAARYLAKRGVNTRKLQARLSKLIV